MSFYLYHFESSKVSILNLIHSYNVVQKLNKKGYSFQIQPYFTCCYPPLVAMGRSEKFVKFADAENPDEYGIMYNRPVNVRGKTIDKICINANGIVGKDLNISYKDADNENYQICHIKDISNTSELIDAIKHWNKKPNVRLRGTLLDIASLIYSTECKNCCNYSSVFNQHIPNISDTDFVSLDEAMGCQWWDFS